MAANDAAHGTPTTSAAVGRTQRTTLITGASAGIGEGFARILAARGDRLILTARRADRLQLLADDLQRKHGTESTVIPADLSAPGGAEALFTETEQRGLNVDLLINNAGFGKYGSFLSQPLQTYQDMIQVNITALVDLSYLYLKGMRARKQGGIINVASIAGFPPMPYFGIYGATKAFIVSFSQALAEEVRQEGIRVSALCPGSTATEFDAVASNAADKKNSTIGRGVLSAEAVARIGLDGYEAGKVLVISGLSNKMLAVMVGLMPRSVLRRAVASRRQ